ncbi:E1 ubiquitin-activating protein uba2 [Geranomyces michiganensis]|nr:E1 ubiquitin-activating protein uba2 [Geranomyces michiganensis]
MYLSELFGKPEDEADTINEQEGSENANEMAHLLREKEALKRLRDAAGTPEYGKLVFEKVFSEDVKGLLVMEDLWKTRRPPTPLDFAEATRDKSITSTPADELAWDRKIWNVAENTRVFLDSVDELATELIKGRSTDPDFSMTFDKDHLAGLNFVTATANLRAAVYGLEQKSRFAVKEMAGNIIPAVATTNAIVAGLIVLTAIKVLQGDWSACKNVRAVVVTWVTRTINPERLGKPNPMCSVCTISSFSLDLNTEMSTLGDLLDMVQKSPSSDSDGLGIRGEISIQEGDRLLYDVDFDDNLDETLADLGIKQASRVLVTNDDYDDETKQGNYLIMLYVNHRENYGKDGNPAYVISGHRALIPQPHTPPAVATEERTGGFKRPAEANEPDQPSAKKQKVSTEEVHVLDEEDSEVLVVL